jgi:addiction module RelE/StbE family toxin
MKIKYSPKFKKKYQKLPIKIQKAFKDRANLFINDSYHPLLNNHALTGEWKGYRSINITGDWRAIFREFDDKNLIYFDTIDTHSNLYRH